MPNDQVGANVRSGFQRIEQALRMPDLVLECAAAKMRLLGRAALELVLNLLKAVGYRGGLFRHKRATESVLVDQVPSNMTELGRVVLVHKENMHCVDLV